MPRHLLARSASRLRIGPWATIVGLLDGLLLVIILEHSFQGGKKIVLLYGITHSPTEGSETDWRVYCPESRPTQLFSLFHQRQHQVILNTIPSLLEVQTGDRNMGSIQVSSPAPSGIEVALGCIQFGRFPNVGGRPLPFASVDNIKPMLDSLQAHGHNKIDTARIYGGGFSEQLLGEADWQKRGLRIETKLHPTKSRPLGPQNVPYSHNAEDLHAGLSASLKALGSEHVDTFYLYAPDRTVPYEDTLREINNLYKAGRFNRWGLCKFPAWEVTLIHEICKKNGWVRPAVFQGIYNALLRGVEPELIPCIRHYGMSFEVAQPIGSGLLTSRYRRDMPDSEHEPGRRFDPSHFIGRHCRERYWFDEYFDALDIIRIAAKPHGLTETECALRWLKHHSVIKADLGDTVIVCASTVEQLEELLQDLEKGPLPADVVDAFEAAWLVARTRPFQYHN